MLWVDAALGQQAVLVLHQVVERWRDSVRVAGAANRRTDVLLRDALIEHRCALRRRASKMQLQSGRNERYCERAAVFASHLHGSSHEDHGASDMACASLIR